MHRNQNATQTSAQFLKVNSTIHTGLAVGLLLFGAVAFVQTKYTGFSFDYKTDPIIIVASLLAIGAFILSNVVFKQKLNKLSGLYTLKEKTTAYQEAMIRRFAPLEGAALFAIVGYLLSGNPFFFFISGLLIIYFISVRPTKQRMDNDLDLSYEEKIQFDETDKVSM